MKNRLYFLPILFVLCLGSMSSSAQINSLTGYVFPGSPCGYVSFTLLTSPLPAGMHYDIYFGDGNSRTDTFPGGAGAMGIAIPYFYAVSGTYSVKMVLWNASGPTDSIQASVFSSNCHTMLLATYLDANSNCIFDNADQSILSSSLFEVDSAGVAIDTISVPYVAGYPARGPSGTIYSFKVLNPPYGALVTCPPSGVIHSIVPPIGDADTMKFVGFESAGTSINDVAVSATFRPALAGGAANRAFVNVYSTSFTGTPAILKFEYSPKFTFHSLVSPGTSAYTVSGTSVSVNLGMVSAYTPRTAIIQLQPVGTLVMNDTVATKFTVFPNPTEIDSTNNIVVRNDTVRSSYDPNQKSVFPSGNITAGTKLEYLLEFENDGNDTAYNIHIMDTLSDYLDANSLRMVGSTHPVQLRKYTSAGKNILKFDFADIRLPDSTHHDYCRGSVTFTIKTKGTLAPGAVVPNRVGIFFDANEVVMTNTAFSNVALPSTVKEMGRVTVVELYPNPVNDLLNISVQQGAYTSVLIYNMTGQLVASKKLESGGACIDVQHLSPGIYYASLSGNAGAHVVKFEKR